jgi:hypothetical protein
MDDLLEVRGGVGWGWGWGGWRATSCLQCHQLPIPCPYPLSISCLCPNPAPARSWTRPTGRRSPGSGRPWPGSRPGRVGGWGGWGCRVGVDTAADAGRCYHGQHETGISTKNRINPPPRPGTGTPEDVAALEQSLTESDGDAAVVRTINRSNTLPAARGGNGHGATNAAAAAATAAGAVRGGVDDEKGSATAGDSGGKTQPPESSVTIGQVAPKWWTEVRLHGGGRWAGSAVWSEAHRVRWPPPKHTTRPLPTTGIPAPPQVDMEMVAHGKLSHLSAEELEGLKGNRILLARVSA